MGYYYRLKCPQPHLQFEAFNRKKKGCMLIEITQIVLSCVCSLIAEKQKYSKVPTFPACFVVFVLAATALTI